MNNSNLIFEGVQLMLTGMGMVFVFLSILVFFTGLMQKVFTEKSLIAPVPADNKSYSDDEEIAAISAAIHQFRKDTPKK